MKKIKLGTSDGATENAKRITELFPQVVTEIKSADGEIERTIDFDALRDLLGDVVEGQRERYQFTWPGKREAKAEARRPIYKTMIPEPGKSKDWDTTENLYIEGDNLDALKILKETYAGKVKLIFIDPPYNTGHDFVYKDDYSLSGAEYKNIDADVSEMGMLVANHDTEGRFHSNWCTMLYPRLLLARDLLAADGVLFVCIDDNEFANLEKMLDEIFGSSNRVANVIWQHSVQPKGYLSGFSIHHNEVLIYQKSSEFELAPLPRTAEDNKAYSNPDDDPNGPWRSGDVRNALYRPNLIYDIVSPSGKVIKPCPNGWRWSKETVQEKIASGEIIFSEDETRIIRKIYLKNLEGRAPETIWFGKDVGTTRDAASEIKSLFDTSVFDTPKPVGVVERALSLVKGNNYLVFDFFAGSSTTAEAVMRKNAKDGGSRMCISVQLDAECELNSVASRSGFKTICNLGEERIRRAGDKIAADIDKENMQLELGAEPKPYPDLGFRVLRIDYSNFKDFYLTPGETAQESLFDFADNVKEGRSDLDLLFEVLPKLGIPYSAKIEERMLAGRKVFFVDGDKLAACFDANVGSDTIEEMAKAKPWYAVIRDSSMADDATHANYEELFRTYSPDTVPQVI